MFRVLVDTCVWLDLAKDHRQQSLLHVLEELVRKREVALIVPRTVCEEFTRNKARVVEESTRSLSGVLKRVKDVLDRFGDTRRKRVVLEQLNDVDHRLPILGESAIESIARIEKLLATSPIIETTDAVKLRAAQRAIDRRAPFHRQRNGIDDAVLIETYADCLTERAPRTRFAFVTHNTKDFSHPTANDKLPHPDIAPCFSRIRSLYFVSLGETLRRVKPQLVSDLMIEEEWTDEPRRLTEIVRAIDEFTDKVWYDRHQMRRNMIESGRIELVDQEEFPVRDHARRPIQRDIWEGAKKAAKRVEAKYGRK
ncbi:MAG TPA: PIN domain-containing protein, partial [Vicinamibacterales bacterium]